MVYTDYMSVALHYQHSQWLRQKRRVEDVCKVINRRILANESLHYSENTIILSDSTEYERLACLHLNNALKLSLERHHLIKSLFSYEDILSLQVTNVMGEMTDHFSHIDSRINGPGIGSSLHITFVLLYSAIL